VKKFHPGRALLLVSGSVMTFIVIAAIVSPFFLPDPLNQDLRSALASPLSHGHFLGTDALGRDVLSRIANGARVSLMVAILGMIGSLTLGTIMGLTSGSKNRWVAWVSDRLIDVQMAFPYILLAIVIVSATTASLPILVLLMVLAGWPSAARVIRSIVLSERPKDYVKAAELVGADQKRILIRYIGPTVVPAILTLAPLQASAMIVMEATLSFLGLGVQPPTPSWGGMLLDGKVYLTEAWWLTTLPGVAIAITCATLIGLGEGLSARLRGDRRRRVDTGSNVSIDDQQTPALLPIINDSQQVWVGDTA
jgi:peptide/nickel transport system permease protein